MITDELREWAHDCLFMGSWAEIDAIADRIDAEHEKAIERARMDGMDATFGNGWVKLPIGADGKEIHVGDELTNDSDLPARVLFLELDGSGWTVYSRRGGRGAVPSTLRHVQPDSWQRIIGDAYRYGIGHPHGYTGAEINEFIDRCKRLAGEGA